MNLLALKFVTACCVTQLQWLIASFIDIPDSAGDAEADKEGGAEVCAEVGAGDDSGSINQMSRSKYMALPIKTS